MKEKSLEAGSISKKVIEITPGTVDWARFAQSLADATSFTRPLGEAIQANASFKSLARLSDAMPKIETQALSSAIASLRSFSEAHQALFENQRKFFAEAKLPVNRIVESLRLLGVEQQLDSISKSLSRAGFGLSDTAISSFLSSPTWSEESYSGLVPVDLEDRDIETVQNVLSEAEQGPAALEEVFRPLDKIEKRILAGVVLAVLMLWSVLMPEIMTIVETVGAYQSLLEFLKKLAS